MADTYDYRLNTNDVGGGTFVMGLLAGAALGAVLGVLFAPKSGSELRNEISDKAGELVNKAQDGYRKATANAGEWAEKGKDAVDDLKDRGKDMYGKAREAASRGAEEAQRYVRDTAEAVAGDGGLRRG